MSGGPKIAKRLERFGAPTVWEEVNAARELGRVSRRSAAT